jgi:MFS family permease
MFGRRTMFISSMIGYTLALLVIGFANSAYYFDVLSGVMGIFCAASVPPAVGSLGAIYEKPSQRKNKAFACFSAGNPMGYVGGMLVSGIASQVANWRASFWALAVIYAIFSLLSIWTVPKEQDSQFKAPLTWENVKKLDPVGMLLAITGIALFSSSLS